MTDLLDLTIDDAEEHQSGLMVPERVIQDLLKVGFVNLKTDLSIVDDLFFKYDKATRTDIKQFLTGNNFPVRLNFPKDDFVFPLLAVVNASDVEEPTLDMLGDYATTEFDTAGTTAYITLGHCLKSEYQIFCLAGKDSNAALWLYYLAKAILVLNFKTLNVHGMHNIIYSGRDITLREDLFPELTYSRMLSLSCDNYFTLQATEKVANKLVVQVFPG